MIVSLYHGFSGKILGGSTLLGKVKWFNDKKGFGFISGEDGNDYFCILKINKDGFKTISERRRS